MLGHQVAEPNVPARTDAKHEPWGRLRPPSTGFMEDRVGVDQGVESDAVNTGYGVCC